MNEIQKRTILFVDDDAIFRELMDRVISRHYPKFELISAQNGFEALEKFDVHKPDIIIVDYAMPIMNGYELSEKILQRDIQSRIIVLSGYLNSGVREQFAKIGITIFIDKPFDRGELYSTIDNLVS